MFFRRNFFVANLQFPKSSVRELQDYLVFSETEPLKICVELRRPTDHEQKPNRQIYALAFATCEREPTEKIRNMFQSLLDKKLPSGSKKPDEWGKYLLEPEKDIDSDGTIKSNLVVPLPLLPPSFQDFCKQIENDLWNHTQRIVRILRWRYGQPGPHNPISGSAYTEWSFDNINWTILPTQIGLALDPSCLIYATHEVQQEIDNLVAQDINEPIGRELYNEAAEQIARNPRSALIMGVAAAEVGMKQYIGEVVPQARWLVEHLLNCTLD
jgi:hypothetical protein